MMQYAGVCIAGLVKSGGGKGSLVKSLGFSYLVSTVAI